MRFENSILRVAFPSVRNIPRGFASRAVRERPFNGKKYGKGDFRAENGIKHKIVRTFCRRVWSRLADQKIQTRLSSRKTKHDNKFATRLNV